MLDKYNAKNWKNAVGVPTGGTVDGVGLTIKWQEGALNRGEEKMKPNGAFVETVIDAVRQRLECFQDSKFRCRENALAITRLEEALHWLNHRTQRRESQETEGTHEGN